MSVPGRGRAGRAPSVGLAPCVVAGAWTGLAVRSCRAPAWRAGRAAPRRGVPVVQCRVCRGGPQLGRIRSGGRAPGPCPRPPRRPASWPDVRGGDPYGGSWPRVGGVGVSGRAWGASRDGRAPDRCRNGRTVAGRLPACVEPVRHLAREPAGWADRVQPVGHMPGPRPIAADSVRPAGHVAGSGRGGGPGRRARGDREREATRGPGRRRPEGPEAAGGAGGERTGECVVADAPRPETRSRRAASASRMGSVRG